MKGIFSILVLAVFCCVQGFDHSLDDQWEKFKKAFGKKYKNFLEEKKRRKNWENNVRVICGHNLENDIDLQSYRMGQNEFTDMSHDEFVSVKDGSRAPKPSAATRSFAAQSNMAVQQSESNMPASVDLREMGLVTKVKDQGNCGSCWTFATTGSLECQQKKKTGELTPLSEQCLVDCARPLNPTLEENEGCKGGYVNLAFDYIKENGIYTEASYPYTAQDGKCNNKSKPEVTITRYETIPEGSESDLQAAVASNTTVSCTIDARNFQHYSGGVFYDPSCSTKVTDADHAVLVVGYGNENGRDYWLVKNSWGATWGENGYMKIQRNVGNHCGIATFALYPLVEEKKAST